MNPQLEAEREPLWEWSTFRGDQHGDRWAVGSELDLVAWRRKQQQLDVLLQREANHAS